MEPLRLVNAERLIAATARADPMGMRSFTSAVTTLDRQASAAAARAAKARTASGGDAAAAAADDDDDADNNADGNGASIGVSATRLPATYKFLKALGTNQEQEERAARVRAHGGGSRAASAGAAASASALSYRDDDGGYDCYDDDEGIDGRGGRMGMPVGGAAGRPNLRLPPVITSKRARRPRSITLPAPDNTDATMAKSCSRKRSVRPPICRRRSMTAVTST